MGAIKIEPDRETRQRLIERALAERRPIDWQIEVELRRAMGLPFPPGTGTTLRIRSPRVRLHTRPEDT